MCKTLPIFYVVIFFSRFWLVPRPCSWNLINKLFFFKFGAGWIRDHQSTSYSLLVSQDVQYTLRSRIDTSHALCANPQNRSNPVGLSFLNEDDDRQLWMVDVHFDQSVTLRSVASGLVLRAGSMEHDKARLSDVKDAQHFTVWLLGRDEGASFFALRPINQLALTLDVVGGKVDAGSTIALSSASKPTQSSFGWWEVAGLRQRQLWGFFPKGGSASVRPM